MKDVVRAKVNGNDDVSDALRNTGSDILIGASEFDNKWGVGVEADNPCIANSDNWGVGSSEGAPSNVDGCNSLGRYLMDMRDELQAKNSSI